MKRAEIPKKYALSKCTKKNREEIFFAVLFSGYLVFTVVGSFGFGLQ